MTGSCILRCDACGSHRPVRKRKARTEPVSENLEEGTIMEVEIQSISKRGDGVVKMGRYIMYVANAKPGQKVKIKISRISGSIVFTERADRIILFSFYFSFENLGVAVISLVMHLTF